MDETAHSNVLVSTRWVADHLTNTDRLRLVETDEERSLYRDGHLPNAVSIDGTEELQQPLVRDVVDREGFEALCEEKGISNDTTVVFYGDQKNWWASYAFWVFKLYGHEKAYLMDGGRQKWVREDRPLTTDVPDLSDGSYTASEQDLSLRAFRDQVLRHMKGGGPLVDVRSPEEFRGEVPFLPEYPRESSIRAGHIPGADNVPWDRAVTEDGTFKSREELQAIYQGDHGFDPARETVTYCRIGERSAHTWFVLRYLLGFERVRNYDGSWTEWGNLVGMPIEQGEKGDGGGA